MAQKSHKRINLIFKFYSPFGKKKRSCCSVCQPLPHCLSLTHPYLYSDKPSYVQEKWLAKE